MSFKEYLKGVITDKDEFLSRIPGAYYHTKLTTALDGRQRKTTWWHRREELRLLEQVYKQTAITKAINYITEGRFSLHVSQNNRNLVAYTPGKDFGERDKQLPTSLGKFLAKYIPELEDHEIGDIVAEHEAELNPDIRWLEGDAIVDYYAETTSVQSCMAHNATGGNKFTDKSKHPTQAYKVPGIRLAVLWKGGKDVARAMTYEDQHNKIYIRAYGDKSLKNWLDSNGYSVGNWVGVQFNTVKVSENLYVMPYLDANGGPGNSSDCNVALLDGKLTCVSLETKMKIQTLGGQVIPATRTDGVVNLQNVVTESFTYQDIITGEFGNILYGPRTEVVYFGHTKGRTAVSMVGIWTKPVSMMIDDIPVKGDVVEGTVETFFHGGWHYEESDERRKSLGYVKLDKTLYPDEQDWVFRDVKTLADGRIVKYDDCVVTISPDGGSLCYSLKSELPKKFYKLGKCQTYGEFYGKQVLADVGNPSLIVTRSGKRTASLVSDVTKLLDGTWIPSRFAIRLTLDHMGYSTVYVDRRDDSSLRDANTLTLNEWKSGALWPYLRGSTPHALWEFIQHFAVANLRSFTDCPTIKYVFNRQGYYYPRLTHLTAHGLTADVVCKMLQECHALDLKFIPGMDTVFAEKLTECYRWYAEATAVEYPSEPAQLPVLESITEPEVIQNESAYYSAA